MHPDVDTGIVGAGLTGLFLCDALARRGVESVVLERDAEPGGVVRSRVVEGRVLEHGPQRARLTAAFGDLVRRLGLEGDMLLAREGLPLFVYRRGALREVPFRLGTALRTDLLSPTGKARLLLEPLRPGIRAGETAEEYFVRRFGREAYEAVLGPLFGGVYASDPGRMDAARALGPFLGHTGGSLLLRLLAWYARGGALPAAFTFREGMQTLPRRLAAAHGDRVRLGAAVERVETSVGRAALLLDGERIRCRAVVLTTPAAEAARLLADIAPDAASRLRSLRYNRLAAVHMLADAPLHGFGYQVAYGEPLRTRGVTWNASLFGRPGLFTAYLGGARDPDLADAGDAELAGVATQEFEQVTGHGSRAIAVSRASIPAWDESWSALGGLTLPHGVHLAANYLSRPGIASRLAVAERLAGQLAERPAGRLAAEPDDALLDRGD